MMRGRRHAGPRRFGQEADHLDTLHRNAEVSDNEYEARKRTLDREFRMAARAEAEKLYNDRIECWEETEEEPEFLEEDADEGEE